LSELECTFDNGLCSFTAATSIEDFLWRIKTSEEIDGELIHGPSFDVDQTTKGHFLFVSGNLDQNAPAVTKLTSPTIKGSPDVTVCLAFKYNLWVSLERLLINDHGRVSTYFCLFIVYELYPALAGISW
jgi:hypothetical protein